MVVMNISELPEGCLSHILSLTSPGDVIRSSAVSKQFLSAVESDTIWAKFLPSDCDQIIAEVKHAQFASRKDLFTHLSRFPMLLDNSTKSVALDKSSGKICYMLGARALSIVWGDTPEYWSWDCVPESRFPECATLKNVCWLEIKADLHTTKLSPGTNYGVYFVFKMNPRFGGFSESPVKVSLSAESGDGLPVNHHQTTSKTYYLKAPDSEEFSHRRRESSPEELPSERANGWMEIEMGSYHVGVDPINERVILKLSFTEVEKQNWKRGLVVQGIEARPYIS